jgi:hypothetical protein
MRMEVSYFIDEYFSEPIYDEVEGRKVWIDESYYYIVEFVNTGDLPVTNLPVSYIFTPRSKDFKILSISHNTTPEHEFGKIEEVQRTFKSRRYIYELLNPRDRFRIFIRTSGKGELQVYTKSEGVIVKKREESSYLEAVTQKRFEEIQSNLKSLKRNNLYLGIVALIIALTVIISLGINEMRKR